ncbi:phage antirepressor [Microbispora sp. ATCC PTA-5024]|uniref:phage antirepressor n=1 Tax=Microbispora sp. ATCC PTA-5024 TaxID=316330 RepID=UPI0003DD905D|nr:phage antirepressor [Microbispora sp. ATCC PTA-5024]ETK36184.1 antirepressor [Microbispora sp. ATCC PTA-5024]
MTELQRFEFPGTGQPVRTVLIDGEPWFVGRDACEILGIADARASLNLLDEDERDSIPVTDSMGRQQMTIVINEPGLYSLILRSRKPEAKAFKRWVTHDVLPAIRKTGSYSAGPQFEIPRTYADALELAARQARAIDAANQRMAELEPAAHAWDVLASAHGDYSVREAAFILNRDPAISTGQNRLFGTLRDLRMIDAGNTPYATHQRHVTLRSRHYDHPRTGEPQLTQQVRITVDGLRYLHKQLGGTAPFTSLIGEVA